ncbi:kinase-like domain-containing protein [Dactylonectria estremocensis]|uniref:non-specific serine/threonine protein kinase n=1 Tax=Dactylonectria estremocensis TaxID=1079267 RepID=A0A9P9F2U5_9HYPO|nr:kinase-like domain-containing protein [Dactylonectria estremocensis]
MDESGPKFELVKEAGPDVWIAVRSGDPRGEKYLARPIDTYKKPLRESEAAAWETLLAEHNQAHAVAQILNHENILSLVGRIDLQPFSKTQKKDDKVESYLVWDYCDASNLSAVFFNHTYKDSSYYLPESFCWHVIRSLTRAVAYLHDGKRVNFKPNNLPGEPLAWESADVDWLPILHRAIEPANIWFQQRRGTETYGLCKLGDFGKAMVSCHVVNADKQVGARPFGMSLATTQGNKPLLETLGKYQEDIEDYPEHERPYTLVQELWSVGAVVFTMMTGRAPTFCCKKCGCSHIQACAVRGCLENVARGNGCKCKIGGCKHISGEECTHTESKWRPCPADHRCREPIINLHTYLARAKYTYFLRDAVKELIISDPKQEGGNATVAVHHVNYVESMFQSWKDTTEEGKQYRSLDDDMTERWRKQGGGTVPMQDDEE